MIVAINWLAIIDYKYYWTFLNWSLIYIYDVLWLFANEFGQELSNKHMFTSYDHKALEWEVLMVERT